jgi:hypothetical protein
MRRLKSPWLALGRVGALPGLEQALQRRKRREGLGVHRLNGPGKGREVGLTQRGVLVARAKLHLSHLGGRLEGGFDRLQGPLQAGCQCRRQLDGLADLALGTVSQRHRGTEEGAGGLVLGVADLGVIECGDAGHANCDQGVRKPRQVVSGRCHEVVALGDRVEAEPGAVGDQLEQQQRLADQSGVQFTRLRHVDHAAGDIVLQ